MVATIQQTSGAPTATEHVASWSQDPMDVQDRVYRDRVLTVFTSKAWRFVEVLFLCHFDFNRQN